MTKDPEHYSQKPFPMPPGIRERALAILCEEARGRDIPPALLVAHLPKGDDRKYTAVKVLIWRRILDEIPGTSKRMLARAFRRDPARIRELLKKNPRPECSSLSSDKSNDQPKPRLDGPDGAK